MESLATLDAKFMNCFFTSKKLSIDDFRIQEASEASEANEANEVNQISEANQVSGANQISEANQVNQSSEANESSAQPEPSKPAPSSPSFEPHRYASFIQSRISAGVRMVDASEALLRQPAVQQLWTRFRLRELVAPIEDVLPDCVSVLHAGVGGGAALGVSAPRVLERVSLRTNRSHAEKTNLAATRGSFAAHQALHSRVVEAAQLHDQ